MQKKLFYTDWTLKTKVNHRHQRNDHAKATFFRRGGRDSTSSFFTSHLVQTKLTVGQPGDKYEQEADAMADRVVNRPDNATITPSLQAKCDSCEEDFIQRQEEEEEEMVQMQPEVQRQEEEEELLQPKSDASGVTTTQPGLVQNLLSTKGRGQSLPTSTLQEMSTAFGKDFSGVRIHTGDRAAQMNRELHAKAFTHQKDVYFNAGNYDVGSRAGKQLLAHELTHVVQQNADSTMIQRDIDMPPTTVQSTAQPVESGVSGLERLRGQGVTPSQATVSRGQAAIERNAPLATERLPYTTGGGWNAQTILRRLGQYDRMAGTDSDAIRCVQAVAMAGRIPAGPESVVRFISGMILQGMLTGSIDQRRRVALRVLQYVQSRIEDGRATYGDLSWAQEALHDLFYSDVEGTPAEDIHGQIVPIIDLDRTMHRMDEWCNSPADVMSHAATLQEGEQLLVNTWKVFFNNTFIDLEEQGINVPVGRSRTVEVVREGRRPRRVRLRRIDASRRPAHTQINEDRDSKAGHQLLIYRDASDSQLKLYEPEVTRSGQHLINLGASGAALSGYFEDLPDIETYEYIQILGKITPTDFASPFSEIP